MFGRLKKKKPSNARRAGMSDDEYMSGIRAGFKGTTSTEEQLDMQEEAQDKARKKRSMFQKLKGMLK